MFGLNASQIFFLFAFFFLGAGRGPIKSSKSRPQGPADLVDRGQQESGGQVAGKTRLSIPSPSPCLFTPKTSVFLRCLDTHAQASQRFFICSRDITTRSMRILENATRTTVEKMCF